MGAPSKDLGRLLFYRLKVCVAAYGFGDSAAGDSPR